MKIKVYQATICYQDFNTTTVLCETLEKLNEIISRHKDYLCFERFEIRIEVENGITKNIVYDCLDID